MPSGIRQHGEIEVSSRTVFEEKMKKEYNKRKTIIYVEKGKDVLKWLKAQL
jgi:hypothetical protein